jgi:hypothetical protein
MDSLFAPTWALLHHAGAFTNVHQDAEGFSVAGQVLGDRDDPQPKMWGIMSFKDPSVAAQSHEKIAQRISELCEYRNLAQENDQTGGCWDDEIWKECEVDIVYLRPGDILSVLALFFFSLTPELKPFQLSTTGSTAPRIYSHRMCREWRSFL